MLENIQVQAWMSSNVKTVAPDTSMSDAYQDMKLNNIRRLPVVNKHNELVGIVTIGDVREAKPSDVSTLSIWELNYLWAKITVDKVMTRDVMTIHPDAPILDAAEMMLNHKISGIPVVDNDDNLVGIVTESDIFRMLVQTRLKAETL